MANVGLILVSHSGQLAQGLYDILLQVAPDVPIRVAGGTDENDIGTSPFKIKGAIEAMNQRDGCIVLFDLGSALMNTELALEWLDNPPNVKIADAPFVEGAYVAAVESSCGKSLDDILSIIRTVREQQKYQS